MRKASLLVLALMMLTISACGEAATPLAAPPLTTLSVRQVLDTSGALYVEGSLGYIRLVDSTGSTVFEKQLDPEKLAVSKDVPPGEYVLQSWQRPCDGNCGYLDPPTDRCDAELDLASGGEVRVTITLRPAEGCDIKVS
jgi:hypothetical protein